MKSGFLWLIFPTRVENYRGQIVRVGFGTKYTAFRKKNSIVIFCIQVDTGKPLGKDTHLCFGVPRLARFQSNALLVLFSRLSPPAEHATTGFSKEIEYALIFLELTVEIRFKGKWFSVMAEKYCRKILTRKLVEMYTVRGDFLRLKSSAEKYCLAQVSREWANTKLFQSQSKAHIKRSYILNWIQKSRFVVCVSGGAGLSTMKTFGGGISEFFYNANQKPSEVERELKDNLLKLARSSLVSPFYCENKSYCKSENVHVYV